MSSGSLWNGPVPHNMVAQMVKNLPAMQETQVPSLHWEDSPREGNGNSFRYPCLQSPLDGGAWRATVYGVAKSRTRLGDLTLSLSPHNMPTLIKNLFSVALTSCSCTFFICLRSGGQSVPAQ